MTQNANNPLNTAQLRAISLGHLATFHDPAANPDRPELTHILLHYLHQCK